MAPIRRYLRITKYSVLECRIYLDNPALAESWLLNPRNPILPRVIESVRPLVLPKLREENERSKSKGKKKGVKDVVVEEDFDVSIFLTETSTRHTLLTKQKHFKEAGKAGLVSNSQKLTGGDTNDTAIEVDDAPTILREESEEDALNLQDLPDDEANISDADSLFVSEHDGPRRSKRARTTTNIETTPSSSQGSEPQSKRRKDIDSRPAEDSDDKKKMAMSTTYDGFSIYGRVLCLVVKRKDKKGKGQTVSEGGQARMENWITSTQMPVEDDREDDG